MFASASCRMRMALRLASLRRVSSNCSSAAKPGLNRTMVAVRKPPANTVTAKDDTGPASFRANVLPLGFVAMVALAFAVSAGQSQIRAGKRRHRGCFRLAGLFRLVHPPVRFGQQLLGIGAVVGIRGLADAHGEEIDSGQLAGFRSDRA